MKLLTRQSPSQAWSIVKRPSRQLGTPTARPSPTSYDRTRNRTQHWIVWRQRDTAGSERRGFARWNRHTGVCRPALPPKSGPFPGVLVFHWTDQRGLDARDYMRLNKNFAIADLPGSLQGSGRSQLRPGGGLEPRLSAQTLGFQQTAEEATAGACAGLGNNSSTLLRCLFQGGAIAPCKTNLPAPLKYQDGDCLTSSTSFSFALPAYRSRAPLIRSRCHRPRSTAMPAASWRSACAELSRCGKKADATEPRLLSFPAVAQTRSPMSGWGTSSSTSSLVTLACRQNRRRLDCRCRNLRFTNSGTASCATDLMGLHQTGEHANAGNASCGSLKSRPKSWMQSNAWLASTAACGRLGSCLAARANVPGGSRCSCANEKSRRSFCFAPYGFSPSRPAPGSGSPEGFTHTLAENLQS